MEQEHVKRTTKQRNNIKKGCANGNKQAIITAQKQRHIKDKINKLLIQTIRKDKQFDKCMDWIYKLEEATTTLSLNELLKEIESNP